MNQNDKLLAEADAYIASMKQSGYLGGGGTPSAATATAGATEPEQQGIIGDTVDTFQRGLYLGLQGVGETAYQFAPGIGSDIGAAVRDFAGDRADLQMEEMSPRMREAMGKQIFDEDTDGNLMLGDGAYDGYTWLGNVSQAIGQYADVMVGGAGLAKAGLLTTAKIVGKSAAKKAAKAGATKEAAEAIGKKAAEAAVTGKGRTVAQLIGYGGVGAAMSGGMIGEQTREEILNLPDNILDQSEEYQKAYWQLAEQNPESDVATLRQQAKELIAEKAAAEVQRDPMLIASNFAMDAIGGKFLDDIFRGVGTGSRLTNSMKQMGIQGTTEAFQGGIEQYASNQAIIDNADPNRDPWQDVKSNAATEGVMGGLIGGAGGLARKGQMPASDGSMSTEGLPEYKGDALPDAPMTEDELAQINPDYREMQTRPLGLQQFAGDHPAADLLAEKEKERQRRAAFEEQHVPSGNLHGEYIPANSGETEQLQPQTKDTEPDDQLALPNKRVNLGLQPPTTQFNVTPEGVAYTGRQYQEQTKDKLIDPAKPERKPDGMTEPYSQPKQSRKALNRQNDAQVEPEQKTAPIAKGKRDKAFTPDNQAIDVSYSVIDLADLKVSHDESGKANPDYPQELQQRERENVASQAWIAQTAAQLNPERLAESPNVGDGAPIIGPDGVVESGNGRTAAIRLAYRQGTPQAKAYQDHVRRKAQDLGIPLEKTLSMKNPVLVRVREGDADRKKFTRQANRQQVAGQNRLEQARTDAEIIDADMMRRWNPSQSDGPLAASNQDFVRAFAGQLGKEEVANLMRGDGTASGEMGRRIEAAVFHKAYQNDRLTEMQTEIDGPYKNLVRALSQSASDFAIARELNPEMAGQMAGTIGQAVELAESARRNNQTVKELIDQQDAFADAVSEDVAVTATFIATNRSKPSRLSAMFTELGQILSNQAHQSTTESLFGDQPLNPQEMINEAQNRIERTNEAGAEPGLRESEPDRQQGREVDAPTKSLATVADAPQQDQNVEPETAKPDTFDLQAQTEQELQQQADANAKAEAEQAAAKKAEEARAQADAELGSFNLTGSDSAVDQLEAQGQSNLFDAPAEPKMSGQAENTSGQADKEAESKPDQENKVEEPAAEPLYSPYERETSRLQVEQPAKRRLSNESQIDLFTPSGVPDQPAAQQAKDNFALRYEQVEAGTVRVASDVIKTASDAAHVAAPFRKHAQETMLAMVTDKSGKIVNYIRHTKGAKNSSSVYPVELVSAIAATDGAHSVWFAHNHPSGNLSPSDSDFLITDKLKRVMDGTGIDIAGHVVVAPGYSKATLFKPGDRTGTPIQIKPGRRTGKVSVTERILRKRTINKDTPEINSPAAALRQIRRIHSPDAIMLLTNQHKVIGSITITADEMKALRDNGRVNRIIKHIDETNAAAVIIKSNDEAAAKNIIRFFNHLGEIRVLDWFSGSDGDYYSESEKGNVGGEGEVFFRRSSTVRGGNNPKGMPLDEVVRIADEFVAGYKGNIPLKAIIRNTQEEIYGPEATVAKEGRIKGAYHGARGAFTLAAANLSSVKDARETLRHEILGHYGLNTLLPEDKKALLEKIIASKNDRSLRKTWEKIAVDYSDLTEIKQAEEVFAAIAEKIPNKPAGVFIKLMEMLNRALRKVGLLRAPATYPELRALSLRIADAIKDGSAKQQTFPKTDDAQFSKNAPEPSDQQIFDNEYPEGMTAEQVSAIADGLGNLKQHLNIVATPDDLPPIIKLTNMIKGIPPWAQQGVYRDGKVYIVASNLQGAQEAIDTIIHEVVGHAGMRALLGKELTPVMLQIFDSFQGTAAMEALQEKYDHYDPENKEHRQYLAEELLAHAAEYGEKPGLVKRAIAQIRRLLRKVFPNIAWTSNDIYALIDSARRFVERKNAELGGQNNDSENLSRLFGSNPVRAADAYSDLSEDAKSGFRKIGPDTVRQRAGHWLKAVWDRAGLKMRQGLVDKYASLMELDKQLLGDDAFEGSITSSSFVLARMAANASNAVATLMQHGRIYWDSKNKTIDVDESTTGKGGLTGVLYQLGTSVEIERFMGWIAANRAEKLMKEGREHLFTKKEIEAMKAANTGTTENGQDRAKLYDKVFKEFQQYRNDVLSIADQAGILRKAMSPIDAAMTMARNHDAPDAVFAALRQAKEAIENEASGKAAKKDLAGDSAADLLKKAEQALEAHLKAKSEKKQSDALEDPDAPFKALMEEWADLKRDQRELWENEFYVPFYRVIEDDVKANKYAGQKGLSRQEAYKRLKGGKQNLNDLLENTLMNFHHLIDASLKNIAATQAIDNATALAGAEQVTEAEAGRRDHSTWIMREGKKEWYGIDDPLLYNSLVALTAPALQGAPMTVMRWAKRIFTQTVTITPQFQVANLLRDSMQAIATSKMPYNAGKNAAKGMAAYGVWNKTSLTRARMMATGGSMSFGHIYGADPEGIKLGINSQLKKAQLLTARNAGSLLKKGWDKWMDVNDSFENANRAAIFEHNYKDGQKLKAAWEARDLIDFSAHGAWPTIRFLIDTVPFLNARIQGLDKLYRSGVKPSAKVIREAFGGPGASASDKAAAKRFNIVTGAIALATMALYLANKDDEEYKKLEEWQKDTYWFIRMGDSAVFIPKPFEVGAIATFAERTLEQIVDDEATGELFAKRMGHMLSDTFSMNPTPQLFNPLLEVYANHNSFTDRPIESQSQQRLSPGMRQNAQTSSIAAGIGGALNISPLQIDHLIQGYFGQLGVWTLSATTTMTDIAQGKSTPEKAWTEYQPIRRFYRDLTIPGYTKYQTLFYDRLNEVRTVYADIKKYRELGELEKAAAMANQHQNELAQRLTMERISRRLSKLNARARVIRASNMDGELKRRELDRIQTMKNRLTEITTRQLSAA